ncbi:Hematopoietically-expressed homeobox protein HHEX [Orchesella cincta]|uniref:Hematopoietically-expressed homeobox protein HHEX n=1 Tax=Orchesella cincta TaxID=48709 RepID=A0A1D2N794_ORCCI|nr:Hematopoietically-expressed homeobox protein HHEX [Orchesella cincta]
MKRIMLRYLSLHGTEDDVHSMYPLGRSLYPTTCKRKGGQIRFNNSQTAQLEKAFVQQKYLNANDRKKLAQSLGLTDRQVKTWFQNRRAKLRKCKGGVCTESEVSGSPLDSRATSPYENVRYDTPLDVKTLIRYVLCMRAHTRILELINEKLENMVYLTDEYHRSWLYEM